MDNKSQLTINDIADLTGVSKRTVSRVLNGSPLVGEATRIKIQNVIKQTNFQPDKQARGLASKRSYLLGVIYDNPDALYIDQVQRGTLEVCTSLGYELIVHPCQWDSDGFIDDCIDFMGRSRVDGVLILPPVSESRELALAFQKQGYRYVRIASADLDDHKNIVISNDRKAMAEIADHLVSLGHTDIGIISGPSTFCSSNERMQGLLSALKSHRITVPKKRIVEGQNDYESGLVAARKLLSGNSLPTAIFANNDEMATAVIRVAYDLGLKIPADLSVVGFDDNLIASRIVPSLTTIKRPVKEIAALATNKLIQSFSTEQSADKMDWEVLPYLVERESTGSPR